MVMAMQMKLPRIQQGISKGSNHIDSAHKNRFPPENYEQICKSYQSLRIKNGNNNQKFWSTNDMNGGEFGCNGLSFLEESEKNYWAIWVKVIREIGIREFGDIWGGGVLKCLCGTVPVRFDSKIWAWWKVWCNNMSPLAQLVVWYLGSESRPSTSAILKTQPLVSVKQTFIFVQCDLCWSSPQAENQPWKKTLGLRKWDWRGMPTSLNFGERIFFWVGGGLKPRKNKDKNAW